MSYHMKATIFGAVLGLFLGILCAIACEATQDLANAMRRLNRQPEVKPTGPAMIIVVSVIFYATLFLGLSIATP